MVIDILGVVLLVALICGLAYDVYKLGRRNGYHQGQLDAALIESAAVEEDVLR